METLLHVEPLTRHITAPLSIGHSDYVFYGDQETSDDEKIGYNRSNICLGSPLHPIDPSSTRNQIPLVKTVGKIPNYHIRGEVPIETMHLLDGQTLIPIRMKLRGGFGEGLCVSHLPSLNLARKRLTGDSSTRVVDPRSDITQTLINNDKTDKRGIKPWVRDWVQDDMLARLRGIAHTTSVLSTDPVERMIDNYMAELSDVPNEMSVSNAQQLWDAFVPERHHIPPNYHLPDPITIPLSSIKHQIVPNTYDFRSWGTLDVSNLPQMALNPRGLETYAEWFDDLPLTDFNVDLVCGYEGEVLFYHCHLAVNRFDSLKTHPTLGMHNGEYLESEFDHGFLTTLLDRFVKFHPNLDTRTQEWINMEVVKIKLIKTMREEAAILLYPSNGDGNASPVAGVKFDLGLQFLAPMSVLQEAI